MVAWQNTIFAGSPPHARHAGRHQYGEHSTVSASLLPRCLTGHVNFSLPLLIYCLKCCTVYRFMYWIKDLNLPGLQCNVVQWFLREWMIWMAFSSDLNVFEWVWSKMDCKPFSLGNCDRSRLWAKSMCLSESICPLSRMCLLCFVRMRPSHLTHSSISSSGSLSVESAFLFFSGGISSLDLV